jgi:putative SOS response-associated peptidase YedK
MCGRYAVTASVHDLVSEFEVDDAPPPTFEPDYNVAPTKPVPVVLARRRIDPETGETDVRRHLAVMRWGLVPSWAKDPSIGSRLINARSETLTEKPAYRQAFARRRCLLPAAGYYEWWAPVNGRVGKAGKPLKWPYFIRRGDGASLAMAGLYEFWRDKSRPEDDPAAWWTTVTVVTTDAQDDVGHIHDRMPLLVPQRSWREWLDPDVDGSHEADHLQALLIPAAPGLLTSYPVSRAVNDVRNNGPELMVEVAVDSDLLAAVDGDFEGLS